MKGTLVFTGIVCTFTVSATPPSGWFVSGNHRDQYEAGIDTTTFHSGKAAAYIKGKTSNTEPFGTLMQQFSGADFVGKRIRLSAYIKTSGVSRATLWMRTDGLDPQKANFDNMEDRKPPRVISGDTDWQRYEVVLDVPEDTFGIAFGVMLEGKGELWCDDFTFDAVDRSVPSTNIDTTELLADPQNVKAWQKQLDQIRAAYKKGPPMPVNLDFESLPAATRIDRWQSYPKPRPSPANGWIIWGDHPDQYETGVDTAIFHGGKASAFLKAKGEKAEPFGALVQEFGGSEFVGKRVRLSGYIKTHGVTEAAMVMRTDGVDLQKANFDNMERRPISGDSGWKHYEIVLDVPEDTFGITFGIVLSGMGQVWCDDFTFQVVDRTVASTNLGMADFLADPENVRMRQEELVELRSVYKKQPRPVNLDFETPAIHQLDHPSTK